MLLNCSIGDSWTARKSNQSILKETSPEYSLEGLMLKLQYFGHLMRRTDSLEKTLLLGKIEGRRKGQQRMKWLDGITTRRIWVWAISGSWWWTGNSACYNPWDFKEQTQLSDWTELMTTSVLSLEYLLPLGFMTDGFEIESIAWCLWF